MATEDLDTWPVVPQDQRPKRLYHVGAAHGFEEALVDKGWEPIDVRLLPNKTDADRAESLKAWLEGVRLGSITADPKVVRLVELEARALGLSSGKGPSAPPVEDVDESAAIDTILNFGTNKKWSSGVKKGKN